MDKESVVGMRIPRGQEHILGALKVFDFPVESTNKDFMENAGIIKTGTSYQLCLDSYGLSEGFLKGLEDSIKLINLLLQRVHLSFSFIEDSLENHMLLEILEVPGNLVFYAVRLLGEYLKENNLGLFLKEYNTKKELISMYSITLFSLNSYVIDSCDMGKGDLHKVIATFKGDITLVDGLVD